LKLINVPWDQALDIILQTFNLSKSVDGNVLWIAPTATFTKMAEDKKKATDIEDVSAPLVRDEVKVAFAPLADVSTAITQAKLLSSRGSVTTDNWNQQIVINDTQKNIDKIKSFIANMDKEKKQVMIEAKIVEVGTNYNETLGIRWGGDFIGTPGAAFTTDAAPGSIQASGIPVGSGGVRGLGNEVAGGFSVNTPLSSVTGPGGVLSFLIGSANSSRIALSLSALESIGKSKTLSNPKILTLDNEAATIQQGRTFFIATVSQSGTQTQQQTATLMLSVTPKIITRDDKTRYVQLKVNATDNSLESVNPPVVNTKSINTQAIVKDGETLVLGGIYTTGTTEDETGVPWLGRIPILGWLFKTKTQSGPNIKELLVFITPTVIDIVDKK